MARLNAIVRLEGRGDEAAWQALAVMARERHPVVSLAAACALLHLEPRRGLDLLGPDIVRRGDWPLARVGSLFEQLGPAVVTPTLVSWLVSRPHAGLERVAKLARFGHRHRVASIVRGWLTGSDAPEVIIAALEYVEQDSDLPWVQNAARHDEWRVRMAAARALARVGRHREVEILLDLLRDPVWWVRYHAAHALTRLADLAPRELEMLRETVRDAYAADMLGQAMAEMRWR